MYWVSFPVEAIIQISRSLSCHQGRLVGCDSVAGPSSWLEVAEDAELSRGVGAVTVTTGILVFPSSSTEPSRAVCAAGGPKEPS